MAEAKKKTTKALRSKRAPNAPTRKIQALIRYERDAAGARVFVPPKRIKKAWREAVASLPKEARPSLKVWLARQLVQVQDQLGVPLWIDNKRAYVTHKEGRILTAKKAPMSFPRPQQAA